MIWFLHQLFTLALPASHTMRLIPADRSAPASGQRRRLILAAGSLAMVVALGDHRWARADAATAQPAAATLAQFMALSAWLTSRPSLNVELGRRYFDALAARVA